MAEGRVAEIVRERNRLREVLVQPQRARDRPGDLGDFEGVREASAEVVFLGIDEDLRLVLEAAKRLGVEDTVAIALETGTDRIGSFRPFTATRFSRLRRPWR